MKSNSTIRRQLKKLRDECIEDDNDPVLSRLAYAMECAVHWVIGQGALSLAEEARVEANLLKHEIASR